LDKPILIPIREIIGSRREANLRAAIGKFSCYDKDVEDFLKNKAFDFDKRHRSRTYLIVEDEQAHLDEPIIYGFYTLTIKTRELGNSLSKSVVKRIDGFSKDVLATEAVLLGQLGKNQKYPDDIDGQIILHYALGMVYDIHNLAGGRIVFLECEENPKLIDFYSRNGFEPLQRSDNYLQMIKYL
jgi:hypothetical protein